MSLGNVHLTPQLVQAVRDAVDIVDVASDHTRLQKAGHRYRGLCPLHKEKTPSFSVDPSQGLYYCFGCGKGGDAIGLHMELSGDDFPAAIESLARRYGVPLPSRSARAEGGRRKPELTPVLEAAAAYFAEELRRSDFARRYLAERKIPPELIERHGLGYAPDGWQNLTDALRPELGLERLEAAGLIGRSPKSGRHYDRFRHRLMFPIRNAAGRLVGFGGRTLGDDRAKYVNTAETEEFHKGSLLYGLDLAKKAIREAGRALLVEGYFDVLGAAAAGVEWSVAGMGTSLTGTQAKLLARYAEEVVVGYDGDDAGEGAYRRALPGLLGEGLAVRRARFGAGHDPDSLRLAAGPEAVSRAVDSAADAVEEELNLLAPEGVARDPKRSGQAEKAGLALLATVPEKLGCYVYARRLAQRVGRPEKHLVEKLESLKRGGVDRPRGQKEVATTTEEQGGPYVPGLKGEGLWVTFEDQLLVAFLSSPPGFNPPSLDIWPPPDAFIDAVAGNIYQAFRELYEQQGVLPDAKAVMERLAGDQECLARMARYQSPPGVGVGRQVGVRECLEKLAQRWRKQRRAELLRQIQEAEHRGDLALVKRLSEQKLEIPSPVPRIRGR